MNHPTADDGIEIYSKENAQLRYRPDREEWVVLNYGQDYYSIHSSLWGTNGSAVQAFQSALGVREDTVIDAAIILRNVAMRLAKRIA